MKNGTPAFLFYKQIPWACFSPPQSALSKEESLLMEKYPLLCGYSQTNILKQICITPFQKFLKLFSTKPKIVKKILLEILLLYNPFYTDLLLFPNFINFRIFQKQPSFCQKRRFYERFLAFEFLENFELLARNPGKSWICWWASQIFW